jgi:tripartite-type tricarboxylate transporter receptor subunit TctC
MKTHVRSFSVLGVLCAALSAAPAAAQDKYPARPVQVIVGFAPGASVDVMARNLLNAMMPIIGQQFVVVNRDGVSGTIGFGMVANAQADGYTLGAGPTTPISIAPHLMKNLKYDVNSFEYICQSFENVFTITVLPDSPLKTINDLIATAKDNPGKLTWGHAGVGGVPQLSVSNFAFRSKLTLTQVPYRGDAPMLLDLMAGRLSFGAPAIASIAGRNLRVLAVFADSRHFAFPDAPTFKELGLPSMPPGLNGLFAPKGTPKPILAQLEHACEQAVRSESFKTAAQRLNAQIVYLSGAAFRARAVEDYRYKGELIRTLDIRIE